MVYPHVSSGSLWVISDSYFTFIVYVFSIFKIFENENIFIISGKKAINIV